MKSARIDALSDDPSAVEIRDVPVPEPGPGQVRVRMRMAPVNARRPGRAGKILLDLS